jgi:chitin disaccharide deacetylase
VNGTRSVIFNADDFGASAGINRGVIDGHVAGVVTAASLMVTGRAATAAASLARDHPSLAVGLHWDVWGEDERPFDLSRSSDVRDELRRQLGDFYELMGRTPTHVDSHKHAHMDPGVFPIFLEEIGDGVPVRGDGKVAFIGGFYAQWEWGVTDLAHVSVDALHRILHTEVTAPWTEISCHPGYRSPDFRSVYFEEREAELVTLCEPSVRDALAAARLELASFADLSPTSPPS